MTQKGQRETKAQKALRKKQEKLRKLEEMIALEKRKLAEKMQRDDSDVSDSDDTNSEGEGLPKRKSLDAIDENSINLSAMLLKDQQSEFSHMTTGSLKVAELPSTLHRF